MTRIVVLKTLAGEELLATEHENLSGFTYSKIRIFQVTQQGASLVPWMLLNPDAEVTLHPAALVCEPVEVSLEIEKQYRSATTGIALA